MSSDLVTIAVFDNAAEAAWASDALTQQGITVDFASQEGGEESEWQLRVQSQDANAARQILGEDAPAAENDTPEPPELTDEALRRIDRRTPLNFPIVHRSAASVPEDELTTIVTFAEPVEADLILDQLGRACASGEAMAVSLWYLNHATGGVKIHVAGGDVERAIELLNGLEIDAQAAQVSNNRTCLECETEISDTSEVCWYCGALRDGTPDPTFEHASAPGKPIVVERLDGGPLPTPLAIVFMCCPPLLVIYAIGSILFQFAPNTACEDESTERDSAALTKGVHDRTDDPTVEELRHTELLRYSNHALRAAIYGYLVLYDPLPHGNPSITIALPVVPLFGIYTLHLIYRYRLLSRRGKGVAWRAQFAVLFIFGPWLFLLAIPGLIAFW